MYPLSYDSIGKFIGERILRGTQAYIVNQLPL